MFICMSVNHIWFTFVLKFGNLLCNQAISTLAVSYYCQILFVPENASYSALDMLAI